MPGFAFPTVGPLDLGSPPSRPGHLPSPSVLCSATTAKSPSRIASLIARSPIPCSLPRFVSRFRLVGRRELLLSNARALDQPVPLIFWHLSKETIGSPKFPSCPRRYMPRSLTPVVSCSLALACPGLLPSTRWMASAFPPSASEREVILLSTTIPISRLNHAACTLVPASFVLLLPGLHVAFTSGLLARLWPGGTCA